MPYIERDGVKIHFEEEGRGEPLLLLMGLGAGLSAWEPHRRVYRNCFRCISVDNRGAGLSDAGKAEDCITESMAADAAAVLDSLDIKGAHVAGISMGGAIAQMLAVFRPELVKSLLLINTFARPAPYMRRIMGTFQDCYDRLTPLAFDRLLQEFIYSPATFAGHPEVLAERERELEQNTERRMAADAFRAQCEACMGHDALPYLERIRVPALVVAGKADILTPLSCAEELKNRIPGAKLYVNEGGHVQHFEHLDVFNRISLEFLKKCSGQKEAGI